MAEARKRGRVAVRKSVDVALSALQKIPLPSENSPKVWDDFQDRLKEFVNWGIYYAAQALPKATTYQAMGAVSYAMGLGLQLEGRAAININVFHLNRATMDPVGQSLLGALQQKRIAAEDVQQLAHKLAPIDVTPEKVPAIIMETPVLY